MKNNFFFAIALGASTMIGPSCQKSPSPTSPLAGMTENAPNPRVSERDECFDCPLSLFVEVTNWSTVSYIIIYYTNPANPYAPLYKIFTSATASSYDVCAAPGDVTIQIVGGPAAAYARATGSSDTDHRTIYLVNNGSGTVSCTAEYVSDCYGSSPWGSGGSCGISQG